MQHSLILPSPAGTPRRGNFKFRATVGRITGVIAALLALVLSAPMARAQVYTEQSLYSLGAPNLFYQYLNDGTNPTSSLTYVNGIFYGTTTSGGAISGIPFGVAGYGTIFSFDPATLTKTYLYTFTNYNGDGSYPTGKLAYDPGTGLLYGTTQYGGSGTDTYGDGTVFSFDPVTHVEKPFFSFKGQTHANGQNPYAGLIDVNGTLYGTTDIGGVGNYGTVFAINAATHAWKTLYSFQGTSAGDGSLPQADLTYDSVTGQLYGTTRTGGRYDVGTVFSVNPSTGKEVVVYSFLDGYDGAEPVAGVTEVNGLLFGTTTVGGIFDAGTVFALDPATGIETQIVAFGDFYVGDPESPEADLTYDSASGLLFGSTRTDGNSHNGTLFTVNPNTGDWEVIYEFHGGVNDGTAPEAALSDLNGTLYGTTSYGGIYHTGTIFSLTPAPPIAAGDAYTAKYNTTLTIQAPGVLANDYTLGNGPMTASLVSTVSHGTLTFHSNGSFTYTPSAGYAGTDTFTYQDTNYGGGWGNIATVKLTVQGVLPIAHNDTYAPKYATAYAVKAPGILANDNPGGNPITPTLVSNPSHGSLTLNTDGSFTYTPSAGFVGADTFTYKDTNSVGTSNTATVTLNVYAAVPIAKNDAYTVTENRAYAVSAAKGVLVNDYAGDTGSLTAALVTSVSHGTLTFNADGSFTYTPTTGFTGTDSFTYKDTNAIGTSNTATVTLTVQ